MAFGWTGIALAASLVTALAAGATPTLSTALAAGATPTPGMALAAGATPTPGTASRRVRVAVSAEVATLEGFGPALGRVSWIETVAPGQPAELRVARAARGFTVRGAEGRSVAPPVPFDASGSGRRLAERVIAVAQRRVIASLENPASLLDVAFTLGRAGGSAEDGPLRVVEPGAELRWEARNRSQQPVFITVFAVSPDRGVSLVYPYRSRPKPLRPGDSVDQTGAVDMPEGAREASDRLQLLATSVRIDPGRFLDPQRISEALADLGRSQWFGAHHELSVRRELAEIAEIPADPVVDATAIGSSAAPAARRARRRAPRILHFGIHFDVAPDLGVVQRRVAKLRALCGRGGMACKVRRLFGEGDVFELERRGRRLREGAHPTVAAAWEQAYAIRKGLDAARVEPFLELEMPGPPAAADGDPLAAAESGASPPDDWQLRQVRSREAWAALRRHGRAEGREAQGVLVAQIDTGYRPHPEIWDGAGGARPVRTHAGWDYVDGDPEALETLESRANEDRAPGTGHASVLVSPSGCQLGGQAGCVHGIARGAQLAPRRAQRSETHFHSGRLARALNDAAHGTLPAAAPGEVAGASGASSGHRVEVVSVAMAGPPGWALWRAAREAERRGVLVVASAGRTGGAVLWPARFASTIAVAATGRDCRPWTGSARGPSLDVAAPGAGVWRAVVLADGVYRNAPGSGTAIAAALVSGGAALFLGRFGADPWLADLRGRGGLTRAFRRVLRRASWTPAHPPKHVSCPGRPGWSADLGPGILDAAALVEAVPAVAGIEAPRAFGLRELPLFRSLYPRGFGGRALADYGRLFGVPRAGRLETVAYLEAELLHHYAFSPEVTAAIDALLAEAPSEEAFTRARRALLRQGLSPQLRAALSNLGDVR